MTTSPEELSLRDVISEAYDASIPVDPPEEASEVAEEPNESEESTEEVPVVEEEEAEGEAGEEGEEAGEESPEETPSGADEAVEAAPEGLEPISPPVSWKGEAKLAFQSFPREAQEYIAEREAQRDNYLNRVGTEAAEARRIAEEYQALLPPEDLQQLQLNQISPAQYFGQLIAADRYMREKPQEAVQWLIDRLGVDRNNLTEGASPQSAGPSPTSALEHRLANIEQRLHQQPQPGAQQAQVEIEAAIEKFATATDDKGVPKYPYFNDLEMEMEPFVRNLRVSNPEMSHTEVLEAAYEKALWANPTTRDAQLKRQESARKEKAKKKAVKARKAGSSVNGSASPDIAPDIPTDLRGAVEHFWDKASSS
jgi:hypothetical protein